MAFDAQGRDGDQHPGHAGEEGGGEQADREGQAVADDEDGAGIGADGEQRDVAERDQAGEAEQQVVARGQQNQDQRLMRDAELIIIADK